VLADAGSTPAASTNKQKGHLKGGLFVLGSDAL